MKNFMKRRLTKLVLALVLICCFSFTSQSVYANDSSLITAESETLKDRLSALDGVTKVAQCKEYNGYEQVYLLTFEQPLSYEDPSAGTFEQRVILYYSGDENLTIVNTNGYQLGSASSARKFADYYNSENTNIVEIEYRFFGGSVPDGLDYDSTDLWEYLTSENAAMDFHRVIQSLSSILTGKRMWTGASKGGFTTEYQCYFQEKHGYNDADAFVAWVAPLCDGVEDSRLADSIYTTIGDDMYGKETAKKYRDMVLQAQLELIRHRDELQKRYYDEAIKAGNKFREDFFTSDPEVAAARIWDVIISEFAIGEWQYYLEWDKLESALSITDEDERIEALYNIVVGICGYEDAAYNSSAFPYYVQSACEMGNYTIDLSYLRGVVAKIQESDPTFPGIELPEELEGAFANMYFTKEQIEAFTYSSDVREALLNWSKTTTSNIITIQGACDPWRYVGMPVTDNQNIHRYIGKYNHAVLLYDLTEEEQIEIWNLLNSWLDISVIEAVDFGGNYTLVKYTSYGTVGENGTVMYDSQKMFSEGGCWYCVINKDENPSPESITITSGTSTAYTDLEKGDVNDNDVINIFDAQLAYDIANCTYAGFDKLSATEILKADFNNDKVVDASDARAIQVYMQSLY